ncbi:MAG TPA: thrombospondin type 3 repeat-containing protein [Gemmatimonadales bacterium]|nr:thrombospondin type 3 repeat-containing protein [Gemmatimonadales bacterium]
MRKLAPIFLVMALTAPRLEAQYDRRYEVGLFGAFTKYDKTFGLSNKIGGGVRFSYAVTPMIGLEVEALFQSPQNVSSSTQIEPMIGAGSLVINTLNASRMTVFVLGGYSRLDFGGTSPYRFTDGGFHGGAGAKFYLSSRFALRLEARGIYTPQTNSTFGQKATHLVGSAGFAFFQPDVASGADADHDGVPDKRDACPDTPLGATVDSRGCPADADGDGVLNGIDKCPNTPTGAIVDATGCPHDQDGDGVFDGIDQCPNTPAGVTVDAKGCPLAAAAPAGLPDSDGDGVNDLLDKCPDTPVGAKVDASGCPIDSDHDGVWDGLDKCPDTPAGATVDATGCPHDQDGDGVFDGIDRCPDTVRGTPVDATGCPLDSDKDGVPDNLDKCPNTPPGIQVDQNGCPIEHDTDGDGVPDSKDRCPNTPKGSRVDQFGCLLLFEEHAPAPPGAPPARPTLILQGVNFQTGRSVLTTSSYAVLDQVAASLVANPEIRIEIAGYTDSTGRRYMNLRLSMARAAAVRAYLARHGVGPMRMQARGFGASGYIAPNATPAGRAQNRRVELHKLN